MKKKNLLMTVCSAFVIALVFSSCKKCQDCTFFGTTEEVCEDDFDNRDQYKAAIDYIEASGGNCK